MIDQSQLGDIRGTTVIDSDGDKIGKAGDIYLDDATGRPEWLTVNTGLFGTSESFVPLEQASMSGDQVQVPFDKAKVKGAPRVATDGHLEPSEEEELYRYYGLGTTGGAQSGMATGVQTGTAQSTSEASGRHSAGADDLTATTATSGTGTNAHGTVGHDTSGPTTDSAMTRSEEELRVGTQARESGRARLRKYVVTERETQTVPVSHEEARLEREPITDANAGAAMDGPAISEEEHEVVLHEEVPVVSKEARPVERVRVDTTTVTEQQQVSADVRKERIDLDADTETDVRR